MSRMPTKQGTFDAWEKGIIKRGRASRRKLRLGISQSFLSDYEQNFLTYRERKSVFSVSFKLTVHVYGRAIWLGLCILPLLA